MKSDESKAKDLGIAHGMPNFVSVKELADSLGMTCATLSQRVKRRRWVKPIELFNTHTHRYWYLKHAIKIFEEIKGGRPSGSN